jgi:hypothetical protein
MIKDSTIGPIERPPAPDAPLQRAPDAGADLGMAPADLLENGDWPQTRQAFLATAPPRCPKLRQADPVAGDHAALAFAMAAGGPVRGDRRWRR